MPSVESLFFLPKTASTSSNEQRRPLLVDQPEQHRLGQVVGLDRVRAPSARARRAASSSRSPARGCAGAGTASPARSRRRRCARSRARSRPTRSLRPRRNGEQTTSRLVGKAARRRASSRRLPPCAARSSRSGCVRARQSRIAPTASRRYGPSRRSNACPTRRRN